MLTAGCKVEGMWWVQSFPGMPTSVWIAPWAAADSAAPPPRPRSTNAATTATAAPAIGPARYTQYAVQSPPTRSGPNVRAGFIDVPDIGLPHRPASAM